MSVPLAKMGPVEFGKNLLATNDLDPVYVLLWERMQVEPRFDIRRWLLAYWCFYHVGTASWIYDQADYWQAMRTAAGTKRFHRSSERRHFRGKNAALSVACLERVGVSKLFEPFDMLKLYGRRILLHEVMDYVQTWVGFGPWIAFKVADMLERLDLLDIKFDAGASLLFSSPRKAAERWWSNWTVSTHKFRTHPSYAAVTSVPPTEWAVAELLYQLGEFNAPPRYERPVNVQEAETILCKWGSYMKGEYKLGEDVRACRDSLLKYSRCKTSQLLLRAGEAGELWGGQR